MPQAKYFLVKWELTLENRLSMTRRNQDDFEVYDAARIRDALTVAAFHLTGLTVFEAISVLECHEDGTVIPVEPLS